MKALRQSESHEIIEELLCTLDFATERRDIGEAEVGKTFRGFAVSDFVDDNGRGCSIQSSSALADKIWLGIDTPTVRVMASNHRDIVDEHGDPNDSERYSGWIDYPIPKDASISGRMHLDREQVRALLPHLVNFVLTGDLG